MPFLIHATPTADHQATLYQHEIFFQHWDLSDVEYFSDGHHTLPNNRYAVNGHPSYTEVGINPKLTTAPALLPRSSLATKIFADTLEPLGTYNNVSYVRSPMAKSTHNFEAFAFSGTNNYGLGTCLWIGQCNAQNILSNGVNIGGPDLTGSKCHAVHNGVRYDGYCFESAENTLTCGHMTSLETRFGNLLRELDAPRLPYANVDGPYRCARGSTAVTSGEHTDVRLLVGGCMISDDTNYLLDAEIHVPALCAQPADFRPGCMLPGGTNFDITAVQPTDCAFPGTRGCTSSTALNYDWDAMVDDGSCIEAFWGCTIPAGAYAEVGYNTSFVGSPLRGAGEVPYPQQAAVGNYDPMANALSSCALVIEGCMDPTAVNYDSQATANTNTWCIPRVVGCMMPSATSDEACSLVPASAHCRDRFSANFNPMATVDEGCIAARLGCTSSTALNYDSFATQDFDCYEPTAGCLDRRALNFGCTAPGSSTCEDRPSVHTPGLCTFFYSPPSLPPPSPNPPGAYAASFVVKVVLTVAGDPSDWTEEKQLDLRMKYVLELGLALSAVELVVEAGSVILRITLTTASAAAQASAMATLQPLMASVDAASAFTGQQVLRMPVLYSETILQQIMPPPSAPAETVDVALVSGLAFGGISLVLLSCFSYWYCKFYMPNKEVMTKVVPGPTSSTTGEDYSTVGMGDTPGQPQGYGDQFGEVATSSTTGEDFGSGVGPSAAAPVSAVSQDC